MSVRPLFASLLASVLLGCGMRGRADDLTCRTEGMYDVVATIEVAGVASTHQVVHDFRTSRSLIASMNSAGCKWSEAGDFFAVPMPSGGALLAPVRWCARASKLLETQDEVDLLDACQPQRTLGWMIDDPVNPTQWREVRPDDPIALTRLTGTVSRARVPEDDLEIVAPGFLHVSYVSVTERGAPGFNVFPPYNALSLARGDTSPTRELAYGPVAVAAQP